jgi:hypothetical protein
MHPTVAWGAADMHPTTACVHPAPTMAATAAMAATMRSEYGSRDEQASGYCRDRLLQDEDLDDGMTQLVEAEIARRRKEAAPNN